MHHYTKYFQNQQQIWKYWIIILFLKKNKHKNKHGCSLKISCITKRHDQAHHIPDSLYWPKAEVAQL